MKGLCIHTGHAGTSSYDGECAQCVEGWRANGAKKKGDDLAMKLSDLECWVCGGGAVDVDASFFESTADYLTIGSCTGFRWHCASGHENSDTKPPARHPDWIPITPWAPQPTRVIIKGASNRTGLARSWRRAREWIARRVLMVDVAEDD